MEIEVLVAVQQRGQVEVAVVGHVARAQHHRLGGQRPLGHAPGVLGGELQLEAGGIRRSRPHTEGVQQAVLGRPADLGLFSHRAHSIRIDGHHASRVR